jgi:ribosomal protein S4
MVRVKFKGSYPREVVPVDHPSFLVSPGEVVEVEPSLAKSLIEQTDLWEREPASRKQED